MRQLVYTRFITNNHASFYLWWKEKFVKYQKFSKHYVHECLQNFLLHFMSLLTASISKNSGFLAEIYFIFLKNVLDQTWKSSDTKFWTRWKDWKYSFQVRQSLTLFCTLVALSFGWNCVKGFIVIKFFKKKQVWRCLVQFRSKKLFTESTIDEIFERNCNFHVKKHFIGKF